MDAAHSFVPPPGIGDSRPRDVRLTAAGWALTLAAVVLAISSGVAFTVLVRQSMQLAEIAAVAGVKSSAPPLWLGPVVSIVLLGVAAGCVFGLLSERRLLAEGRAAPALVIALRHSHTSHGGTHRSIVYQFPLLSGAQATGKSQAPRKIPAVGSWITVLYDPDRPSRNQVYPLNLVKTR